MVDLSLFDLRGKTALVTGGARGIGRAAALALATAGADVAIIDLNEEAGKQAVASIAEVGGHAIFVSADVSEPEEVDHMITTVSQEFGRLDIAVNSAGIFRYNDDEVPFRYGDDALETLQDWKEVIGLNLTGLWLCCRGEKQQMCKQTPAEGKIVNVASIAAGLVTSVGSYDASKAGVVQLTRTLAAQWGPYNINVNSVSPGYVGEVFGARRPPEEQKRIVEITPLGYVERLEDLAGAFVFLSSPASDFITGQNLVVDGGCTLSSWLSGPLERSVPPRVEAQGEAT